MGWHPTSVERALKGLGVFFLLSFFFENVSPRRS
jgi:hypothetical protein